MIVIAFAWISFELFKRSEKALDESKMMAKDYAVQATTSAKLLGSAKPLFFADFLQAWRDGKGYARKKALWFESGSTERKAAFFLLSNSVLPETETSFRESFSDTKTWFADFIIGERRLKEGDSKKALEAFRSSYERITHLPQEPRPAFDELMIDFVKARLYVLEGGAQRTDRTTAVKGGGTEE